jgi:2-polyprenyl-3-methyl-5-hydroxy-6-metoxy-1,4-benzoquinol methylase
MINLWDQRFSRTSEFLYGEQPNVWIASALPSLAAGSKVLALADGEGRNSVWLAEQGYQVVNIDYSQVGLEKTQQLAQRRGVVVETRNEDLTSCILPIAHFDAVVSSFFHLPSLYQAVVWHNVINSLKIEGKLVVQVFSQAQLPLTSGGPKDSDLLYRLEDWQVILRSMHIETLEEIQVHLNEGELHQGVANVINIKSVKKE